MDYEMQKEIKEIQVRLLDLRESLDIKTRQDKVSDYETLMLSPNFWQNQEKAQEITQDKGRHERILSRYQALEGDIDDMFTLIELAKEDDSEDYLSEISSLLTKNRLNLDAFELETMLNGKYDSCNAILSIHPGAGGTESQDWAEMLYRLYVRWAERRGFKLEVLDYLAGDEAGIKSVTLLVSGDNAYGYLKAEKGVHRMVRISPFDASGRRHTSFCAVEVMPEVESDTEVEIEAKDLKIDTYRASGAGGQHVNKTESAVRITHLPTGIVVQCQGERSQIQNRATAMKMLTSRLVEEKLKAQERELAKLHGNQQEIGWGSQIRSYVFHPYTMVKDHRTNEEKGNVQAVMDGDIDSFITAYLKSEAQKRLSQ